MVTVQDLREHGYDVHVTHLRNFNNFPKRKPLLMSKHEANQKGFTHNDIMGAGGKTIIQVRKPLDPHVVLLGEGVAVCADTDSFHRKKGLEIAIERALLTMVPVIDAE